MWKLNVFMIYSYDLSQMEAEDRMGERRTNSNFDEERVKINQTSGLHLVIVGIYSTFTSFVTNSTKIK